MKPGRSLILLEPVCKIREEENGSNRDHSGEVGSSFFIASGNAAKLLETIDEPFDNVSLSIVQFIKSASSTLIAATSNGATNMLAMEIVSKGTAGVAFIRNQTLWS